MVQALGKQMGAELPAVAGGSGRVLYPASVKAGSDLQDSLAASGFSVTRISTYNTVGGWVDGWRAWRGNGMVPCFFPLCVVQRTRWCACGGEAEDGCACCCRVLAHQHARHARTACRRAGALPAGWGLTPTCILP